jgi:adenylate cyclase, class 2
MAHLNVEIKARCEDAEKVRGIMRAHGAVFRGRDRQTDVYFNMPSGRLKVRRGAIENAVIYYERPNRPGPRQSDVHLCRFSPENGSEMEALFAEMLGVRIRVVKDREIYFIGNVKFHIDAVEGLGSFVEIEAIDADGSIGRERLLEQCRRFMAILEIDERDLVEFSYSDMLMEGA